MKLFNRNKKKPNVFLILDRNELELLLTKMCEARDWACAIGDDEAYDIYQKTINQLAMNLG